jgi:hypothetical protein
LSERRSGGTSLVERELEQRRALARSRSVISRPATSRRRRARARRGSDRSGVPSGCWPTSTR